MAARCDGGPLPVCEQRDDRCPRWAHRGRCRGDGVLWFMATSSPMQPYPLGYIPTTSLRRIPVIAVTHRIGKKRWPAAVRMAETFGPRLITRRSQVQILPPPPIAPGQAGSREGAGPFRWLELGRCQRVAQHSPPHQRSVTFVVNTTTHTTFDAATPLGPHRARSNRRRPAKPDGRTSGREPEGRRTDSGPH